jgi:transcriptional regulator with XRE-family HTH domain
MKEDAMPGEFSAWLRQKREEQGWARPKMARRLIKAVETAGDRSMPGLDSMCHNLYRWERGDDSPSERYRLYYSRALGIPPGQFGASPPGESPGAPRAPGTMTLMTAGPALPAAAPPSPAWYLTAGPAGPGLSAPAVIAYRGMQEPGMGSSTVRQEVLMGAHEGSEHASRAEQRGIGDMTLEQFRADVMRLSREYLTGEPFALYLEMRRVRGRMHEVLDRRLWPRDASELYLLLGCVNHLMAIAAHDLGYPQAADELLRTAWVYAVAIDHRPLMARVRVDAANNVYWDQPRHANELALAALEYLRDGPNGAFIYLMQGRAAARMGDTGSARRAIAEAEEARGRDHEDDLLAIGGEFNFSLASQRALAGAILVEIPGAEREAGAELEGAIELYNRGPEPGEDHSQHVALNAHVELATTRLHAGQVEGAGAALDPVFAIAPAARFSGLARRLARARSELAAPVFRGSAQASDLAQRIEEFDREETITAGLRGLIGGPG